VCVCVCSVFQSDLLKKLSCTHSRAQLHLVDLAGSERVKKTNVVGQLLQEAKYINLSLHFLEQVCVCMCVCVCVYVCACVCMCVWVYGCICVYV
jgi:hypothetical protein